MPEFRFVTNDARMRDPIDAQRFSAEDVQLLAAAGHGNPYAAKVVTSREMLVEAVMQGGALPTRGVRAQSEQMQRLGALAVEQYERLERAIGRLDAERAEWVRMVRVERRCTWRRVAELCAQRWATFPWFPASNQLAGMALCQAAARRFGEDPERPPWN